MCSKMNHPNVFKIKQSVNDSYTKYCISHNHMFDLDLSMSHGQGEGNVRKLLHYERSHSKFEVSIFDSSKVIGKPMFHIIVYSTLTSDLVTLTLCQLKKSHWFVSYVLISSRSYQPFMIHMRNTVFLTIACLTLTFSKVTRSRSRSCAESTSVGEVTYQVWSFYL